MSDIKGVIQSIQNVAIQGLKNGQEIADRKYIPLIKAAKQVIYGPFDRSISLCIDDHEREVKKLEGEIK